MGEGEEIETGNSEKIGTKRELGCIVNEEAEFGVSPRKKHVGVSNSNTNTNVDDVCSDVTDPNVSPMKENENVSSLEISSSQPAELGSISNNNDNNNNHVNSGEITSESSGNSCSTSCSGVSTSQVTLEIPEHASTTGIRKITFKFSKSKEEYESKLSSLGARGGSNLMNSNDDIGLDDSSERLLYNMELKMSKKVVSDRYPTNVKKLLATGILEGAKVKYISTSGVKEIPGEIRGCGYLCGCTACNFTNVLSAYEFEQHAGGAKTRHPNNHIFLENGRPIYSIIEQLKTAPLGILEELVKDMAGSSVNEVSFNAWKASLQQCDGLTQADKMCHRKFSSNYAAHMRCINDEQWVVKGKANPLKYAGKRLNSSTSNCVVSNSDRGAKKSRDNDLHRLLFMPNGLPDGAELAYYAKGQKILGGYKQGNGIVCGHCNCEISPSQFEAHAGWAVRRQPYRHIYSSSGLTLHDLAISLANGQNLTTGNNDDMCTVCGDRGELIPCSGCPRAYHQTCLGLELVPDGDWCCPSCNERKADFVDTPNSSKAIIIRLTRVVKTPETDCGGCVFCRKNDFSVNKFDDRTVIICDQCEKEYHVGCLRQGGRCNLNELPKGKWFCCNDCEKIHIALSDLVFKGSEMISSSESIKINRKLLEKGLNEVVDNDLHWRVLSGKCRRSEHLPLLSKAVSIFRECFSPITAKSGRDLIPVMVHGRNISGQEFGGMYCVLLTVKYLYTYMDTYMHSCRDGNFLRMFLEEAPLFRTREISVVVSAGLLRIFGREVAELPLVATSKEYQGKGYFQALFSRIEKLLYSLKVENLVLPAAEKAKAMWINRFGFVDMSYERLSLYTKELQLTEFNGTVMLEKKVEQTD